MGDLHLCGFEIPVIREGLEEMHAVLGDGGRAIDGSPGGGSTAEVEDLVLSTPLIALAEARAIADLCRRKNGIRWACDNSVYGSDGTALTDVPSFSTTAKFGTHSITIASGAGSGDIGVTTVASLHTVAGWCKEGAGAWTHYIERSDGAKWVDAVRNDAATMPWTIASSTWTLDQDGTDARLFDDLVYLPFEIYVDWGADWPQTESFSALPELKVTGDLIGGYYFMTLASAKLTHVGQSQLGDSARVNLDIRGGERVAA